MHVLIIHWDIKQCSLKEWSLFRGWGRCKYQNKGRRVTKSLHLVRWRVTETLRPFEGEGHELTVSCNKEGHKNTIDPLRGRVMKSLHFVRGRVTNTL